MGEINTIQRLLFCLMLALACAACDLQQDISFDEAADVPPEGPMVRVVWEQNETDGADVYLNTLDKVVVEEAAVWPLWDILLAAGLEEVEILSMRFDFERADAGSGLPQEAAIHWRVRPFLSATWTRRD